jgi:integrase
MNLASSSRLASTNEFSIQTESRLQSASPTLVAAATRRQSVLKDFTDPVELASPKDFESPSWTSEVKRFLEWKRAETSVGENWIRRMRWELDRVPDLLQKVGATPVALTPVMYGPQHVRALHDHLEWGRNTLLLHFAALRQFLRWAGNPVADHRHVWSLPSGDSSRRRWLTKDQLTELFQAASPRARLLIALEGFNGLRRIEVLRLQVRDVSLSEGLLNVLGKGRMGGKWRQIPLHTLARSELERSVVGKTLAEKVLPLSASGADLLLQSAAIYAHFPEKGVCVSHHDLRRTFGRIAHEAGMDLIQLKNLYGHNSLEQTVHYVGLDVTKMREGLDLLEESLRELSGRTQNSAA